MRYLFLLALAIPALAQADPPECTIEGMQPAIVSKIFHHLQNFGESRGIYFLNATEVVIDPTPVPCNTDQTCFRIQVWAPTAQRNRLALNSTAYKNDENSAADSLYLTVPVLENLYNNEGAILVRRCKINPARRITMGGADYEAALAIVNLGTGQTIQGSNMGSNGLRIFEYLMP